VQCMTALEATVSCFTSVVCLVRCARQYHAEIWMLRQICMLSSGNIDFSNTVHCASSNQAPIQTCWFLSCPDVVFLKVLVSAHSNLCKELRISHVRCKLHKPYVDYSTLVQASPVQQVRMSRQLLRSLRTRQQPLRP